MVRLFLNIRRVLNGTATIDNRRKYFIICFGIALIHLIFMIAFWMGHIMPLFYYNVGATVFYFYHAFVSIRKQRFLFVQICAMLEILFHASLATYMLGWDWGFNMYTMALVPVSFYVTYTLPQIRGKIAIPAMESTIVGIVFILNSIVCENINPIYQGGHPDCMQPLFYYFNIIIAFGMLVVFSILFALEIQYMQKGLENENRALEEVASYDPLTSLLNRRSMDVQLEATIKEAKGKEQEFCVMLADIDNFKKVNDTYGHDCGDMVLVEVSDVISKCVRDKDAVCRWGGEEILVLLKTNLDVAERVAKRICDEVAEKTISYKDEQVKVTVTIGISAYQSEQTIQSMIEEADNNLYYGKRKGKNQYVSNKLTD